MHAMHRLRHVISVAIAIVAVAALVVGATAATARSKSASAPKFHSVSSSVNRSGALVVSFDERGLGNADVDYLLSADAQATYACINRGGHNPSAANKRTVNQTVSTGASFEAKNGRVVASLTAGPPGPGDFSCPPGQRLVLADVSYTNITLTDTTNDVTTTAPDAERTFREL